MFEGMDTEAVVEGVGAGPDAGPRTSPAAPAHRP